MWLELWDRIVEDSNIDEDRLPGVEIVKATSSTGSKMERASQMLVDYELNKIFHVNGDHVITLEGALRRFPQRKPFDLVDAVYWSWSDLKSSSLWLIG